MLKTVYHYSRFTTGGRLPVVYSMPQTSYVLRAHPKPDGLWVCEGEEWAEFTVEVMPDWAKECKSLWTCTIDMARVALLECADDVLEFMAKFKLQVVAGMELYTIDWQKVAKEHSGVWVDYHSIGHENVLFNREWFWLYGWDVPSGCVWDAEAVKVVSCDRARLGELQDA